MSNKLFLVCGPPGSGKSKLINLLSITELRENLEFKSSKIHCQDRYQSYFKDRGYETVVISENPEKSDTLYYLDDLLWIEIPHPKELKERIQEKSIILNIVGTNKNIIENILKAFADQKGSVRIIVVDCSNNIVEWRRRLNSSVLWDEYEIEKLIERGKWFVTKEIPQCGGYWEIVENDSSLEEGLIRLVESIKRSRVHAEDVDNFYSTKHVTSDYIAQHNIQELMELLMTEVLISQPENPQQFLFEYLSTLQREKTAITFNGDDIEGMFDLIDVTGQGKLSLEQFKNALLNLGGRSTTNQKKVERIIEEYGNNDIDRVTFCQVAEEFMKVEF